MRTDDYKHYKTVILEKYKSDGIHNTIQLCVCSHVPLMAMYEFLNEEYAGMFDKDIQRLKDFYGERG